MRIGYSMNGEKDKEKQETCHEVYKLVTIAHNYSEFSE